jgi:2-polyprenyl-3-methyl-5-hydroxy-6-metoxy-1,4-benzoquinol methylase
MDDIDYSIHYARFHSDTEEHADWMTTWMKSQLVPYVPDDRTASILDIGCGYGFALRALRQLGFTRLKGLEVSPQQALRCKNAGFDVEVTGDTIKWLEDQGAQFSFVVLLDVLEHIPVALQIRFVRAIHNALLPGGTVLVTVPNANAILSSRWRYIDYTHFASFTEHSLYFVLKNGGFGSIKIDSELWNFPRRLWKRSGWAAARKWFVRWCWLQVYKAEIPWEKLREISFELNLKALAQK